MVLTLALVVSESFFFDFMIHYDISFLQFIEDFLYSGCAGVVVIMLLIHIRMEAMTSPCFGSLDTRKY